MCNNRNFKSVILNNKITICKSITKVKSKCTYGY